MTVTEGASSLGVAPSEWSWPGATTDVASARNAAADHLSGVAGISVDAVRLIVGELASNVVVHARTPLQLRIAPGAEHVRIEMADGSAAMPVLRRPDPLAMYGRGLHLVHALSARWGATPTTTGKVVWAELVPRDAGPAPDRPRPPR